MARYNPAIHRRRSIRLKGYDYSSPGLYFITICTHKRAHLFGKIRNGTMHLNAFGSIADSEWQKTAEIRPNVQLLEHIIMPNHMHGIIRLLELDDESGGKSGGTLLRAPTLEQFGKPTPNTIPTILRGYKAATTKQINTLRKTPGKPVWQRNYYEHIIRDEAAYIRIARYILANPRAWQADRLRSLLP